MGFLYKTGGSNHSAALVSFLNSGDSITSSGFDWNGSVFNSPAFSISESDIFIYSNGIDLYDQIGRKAINGDSIQIGSLEELILEFRDNEGGIGRFQMEGFIPINDSIIYMIHKGFEFIGLDSFEIDIVDPFGDQVTTYSKDLFLTKLNVLDSGRIDVDKAVKKQRILNANLVATNLTFIKHGNGDDWGFVQNFVFLREKSNMLS